MVWKDNRYFGIGKATSTQDGMLCTFVVARYRGTDGHAQPSADLHRRQILGNVQKGSFDYGYCDSLGRVASFRPPKRFIIEERQESGTESHSERAQHASENLKEGGEKQGWYRVRVVDATNHREEGNNEMKDALPVNEDAYVRTLHRGHISPQKRDKSVKFQPRKHHNIRENVSGDRRTLHHSSTADSTKNGDKRTLKDDHHVKLENGGNKRTVTHSNIETSLDAMSLHYNRVDTSADTRTHHELEVQPKSDLKRTRHNTSKKLKKQTKTGRSSKK